MGSVDIDITDIKSWRPAMVLVKTRYFNHKALPPDSFWWTPEGMQIDSMVDMPWEMKLEVQRMWRRLEADLALGV